MRPIIPIEADRSAGPKNTPSIPSTPQIARRVCIPFKDSTCTSTHSCLGRLGLTRAREILDLPIAALLKGAGGGAPTFDGRSVPRQIWEPDAPSTAIKVPLLLGGTDSERSMVGPDSIHELTDREVSSRLERLLGGNAAAVLAAYRSGYPDATPGQLLIFITTGLWTTKRTTQLAERKAAAAGAPVYVVSLDLANAAVRRPVPESRMDRPAVHVGQPRAAPPISSDRIRVSRGLQTE